MSILKRKYFTGKGPITIAQFLEGIVGGLAVYVVIFTIRETILHSYEFSSFVTGITITFAWATVWWIRKSSLNIFEKYATGYKFVITLAVIFFTILIIYITSMYHDSEKVNIEDENIEDEIN
tara:strand:+ start:984 stop:1349 length:366 start_codon:yes stop_codon:yes gene_type:complete